jgi:hypothetical protein
MGFGGYVLSDLDRGKRSPERRFEALSLLVKEPRTPTQLADMWEVNNVSAYRVLERLRKYHCVKRDGDSDVFECSYSITDKGLGRLEWFEGLDAPTFRGAKPDVYVYTAVPRASRKLIKRYGIYSQQAMLKNPMVLSAYLENLKGTPWEKTLPEFKKSLQRRLKDPFWGDTVQGPSVLFGEPDRSKITSVHPTVVLDTEPVRINLSKILRDHPATRIAGAELKPYDPDGPRYQMKERHYDIDLDQVRKFAALSPEELWKHYDSPEGTHYASDVPHAMIITPSGIIDPKYIDYNVEWSQPSLTETPTNLYHLSEDDLDGTVLRPRIPDNYMTQNKYEDNTTKRASFSPTIDGALIGMSDDLKGKVFYIHEPVSYEQLKLIDNATIVKKKLVPDAHLTEEVWVLSPVKLQRTGMIRVIKAEDNPLKYRYGNKQAETYRWIYSKVDEEPATLGRIPSGPISLMRLIEVEDLDKITDQVSPEDLSVEKKLDGWQIQTIGPDIYSRRGKKITDKFLPLAKALKDQKGSRMIGELVYWNAKTGKMDEPSVTKVAGTKDPMEAALKMAKMEETGIFQIIFFDMIQKNGKDISGYPFEDRRESLEKAFRANKRITRSPEYPFSKWKTAYKDALAEGGEGVVMKNKLAPYLWEPLDESEPKREGYQWKVKEVRSDDFVVYDSYYTPKGSLIVRFGQYHGKKLVPVGEMNNFSRAREIEIEKRLKKGPFLMEIVFQERFPKPPGKLRNPRFLRFREDLEVKSAKLPAKFR